MTGIAALAMCAGFTSCSHDLSDPTQEDINNYLALKVTDNYKRAFINQFGQPAENQDWGFSSASNARALTRANSGEDYPATHYYTDANGKNIAGANMNHNQWGSTDLQSNPFGGWIVPDPLTEGQKERVRLYFQANPNLSYEDPHFRHFYVQQVYKGGTKAPQTGNKESTIAVNGTSYNGSNMNLLTVGVAESHINDFNNGNCTTSNVLNHEGKTQSDQITLMVNVDDTSCFGYHNTGASIQKNDKMALVSAATIDAWAAQNGNPGEAVVDKWNRSFMGFDFELYSLEQAYAKNGNNNIYAPISDVPGNAPQYVWDGTKVIKRGSASANNNSGDLTSNLANGWVWNYGRESLSNENGVVVFNSIQWGGCGFGLSDANWSTYDKLVYELEENSPFKVKLGIKDRNAGEKTVEVDAGTKKLEFNLNGQNLSSVYELYLQTYEAGTIKISKVYLVGDAPKEDYYDSDYIVVNGQQIPFLSTNTNMYSGDKKNLSDGDMKTNQNGKECLNLPKFKELVEEGYLPVKDKNLREWVKWQGGDGYYSDWIVTLTEAKRIPNTTPADLRIMSEDLSATDASDFDFNDVVFDVYFAKNNETQTKILVRAAGGTLPLRIKVSDTEWQEVHGLWDLGTGIMINTGAEAMFGSSKGADNRGSKELILKYAVRNAEEAKNITIEVEKASGVWVGMNAETGEPAAKFAIPAPNPDAENWCKERTPIQTKYTKFTDWVTGQNIKWWLGSVTE